MQVHWRNQNLKHGWAPFEIMIAEYSSNKNKCIQGGAELSNPLNHTPAVEKTAPPLNEITGHDVLEFRPGGLGGQDFILGGHLPNPLVLPLCM